MGAPEETVSNEHRLDRPSDVSQAATRIQTVLRDGDVTWRP